MLLFNSLIKYVFIITSYVFTSASTHVILKTCPLYPFSNGKWPVKAPLLDLPSFGASPRYMKPLNFCSHGHGAVINYGTFDIIYANGSSCSISEESVVKPP